MFLPGASPYTWGMRVGALQASFKAHGARATLSELCYRGVNHLILHQSLMCLGIRLEDLDPRLLEPPSGFEGRFLTLREIRALSAEEPGLLSTRFLASALAKGDRCYAILDQGHVASFGWYSRQPTHVVSRLTMHFDPASVYMYHGHTRPEYRGKRLHAIGMARALQAYTDEGCQGMVTYVESVNLDSLRSCRRLGCRPLGRIRLVQVFGRVFTFTSAECRQHGFRLVPSPATR
jgi:hypothetical protein